MTSGGDITAKIQPIMRHFQQQNSTSQGDATQIWTAEIGVKIEGLPLSDHYKINFHMIA